MAHMPFDRFEHIDVRIRCKGPNEMVHQRRQIVYIRPIVTPLEAETMTKNPRAFHLGRLAGLIVLTACLAPALPMTACSDDSGTGQVDGAGQDGAHQDAGLHNDAAQQDGAVDHDGGQPKDATVDGGGSDGGSENCPMGSLQMHRVDPVGPFTMGSPVGELGREDEIGKTGDEIQHQVTLTHSYEIGIYEITRTIFVAFMGYNPSTEQLNCMDCPVDELTWGEAAAFTNAVSACANLTPCYNCNQDNDGEWTCTATGSPYDCTGYRLPTEAEWEYAARAGVSAAYTNGGNLINAADELDLDGNVPLDNSTLLDDICWFHGNAGFVLHPVGTKPPNAWGLYNVIGNAAEWCHDWVAPYTSDPIDNPWGPATGTDHIIRGGNFESSPAYHRLAYRNWYDNTLHIIGGTVRLARTVQ